MRPDVASTFQLIPQTISNARGHVSLRLFRSLAAPKNPSQRSPELFPIGASRRYLVLGSVSLSISTAARIAAV